MERSRRPNEPTRRSIPFIFRSLAMTAIATMVTGKGERGVEEAVGREVAAGGPVAEVDTREAAEVVPASSGAKKNRTPTARKSWRRCPRKLADVVSKFRGNRR